MVPFLLICLDINSSFIYIEKLALSKRLECCILPSRVDRERVLSEFELLAS